MRKHLAGFALAFGTLLPAAASAQDAAGAEALFQKAHTLFEQKKYAEACPKFAESFRLDPATGALLALASCHEAEGKLASAWVEYLDVATRSRREGKNDRADAAQQRATTLEPKLARLTIAAASGVEAIPDLVVKRDGVAVGAGTFGTALPVDKGEHVIEASAPGRQPFTKRVTMQDGAAETVAIPLLAETGKAVDAPPPGEKVPADKGKSSGGGFPLKTVGLVTGGVGVVLVGVGGYFGISAIGKNQDSNKQGCSESTNVCSTPQSTKLRRDAIDAGNTSTGLIVIGGLLTAAGVAMFVLAKPSPSAAARGKTSPSLAGAPAIAPGQAGFALSGSF